MDNPAVSEECHTVPGLPLTQSQRIAEHGLPRQEGKVSLDVYKKQGVG